MKPIILFRQSLAEENEIALANNFFDIVEQRTQCKHNLVISRYSALPYYQELETDLSSLHCKMINTYKQHKWIANFEYYEALKEYTPETWDEYSFQDCSYDGPFIVKGKTNSKKFQWNKLMFARTKKDAIHIGCELLSDSMIGCQDIIYRKYIPLKTLEFGTKGLPFSNEWRLFYLGNKLLSYGYYWSCASEKIISSIQLSNKGFILADKIAKIASEYTNFFVIDIAETDKGDWILIEINDGQMSGLSENNARVLYGNLKIEMKKKDDIIFG